MVAAHHNQDLFTVKVGTDVGDTDGIQYKVVFALEVRHGVMSESGQLGGDTLRRLRHSGLVQFGGLPYTVGKKHVARVDGPIVLDAELLSFPYVHDLRTEIVDKGNAGSEKNSRAEVRVATGRGLCSIENRSGFAGNEGFCGDPVEVLVIDHGDLALVEALRQILRP